MARREYLNFPSAEIEIAAKIVGSLPEQIPTRWSSDEVLPVLAEFERSLPYVREREEREAELVKPYQEELDEYKKGNKGTLRRIRNWLAPPSQIQQIIQTFPTAPEAKAVFEQKYRLKNQPSLPSGRGWTIEGITEEEAESIEDATSGPITIIKNGKEIQLPGLSSNLSSETGMLISEYIDSQLNPHPVINIAHTREVIQRVVIPQSDQAPLLHFNHKTGAGGLFMIRRTDTLNPSYAVQLVKKYDSQPLSLRSGITSSPKENPDRMTQEERIEFEYSARMYPDKPSMASERGWIASLITEEDAENYTRIKSRRPTKVRRGEELKLTNNYYGYQDATGIYVYPYQMLEGNYVPRLTIVGNDDIALNYLAAGSGEAIPVIVFQYITHGDEGRKVFARLSVPYYDTNSCQLELLRTRRETDYDE